MQAKEIRAMPIKWAIYTKVERQIRIQKGLIVPDQIIEIAIQEDRRPGQEPNMMLSEKEKKVQMMQASVSIEEFNYYEEDGWLSLRCSVKDVQSITEIGKCWELERMTPNSTENTENFFAEKEKKVLELDEQISRDLSGISMFLPAYINLNIIRLRKLEVCGNSLLRGRNWAFPTNPSDLYLFWDAFEMLNGWKLPVPLFYTRQAFSQWYLQRICPHDKDKYRWSMNIIQRRKQQAQYATFLDWTKQNRPYTFQEILKRGNDQVEMGKIFGDYVRRCGYPKPSYHLIGSYRYQLNMDYFSRQFNQFAIDQKNNTILVLKNEEVKLLKQLGDKSGHIFAKVSDDFQAYSEKMSNMTIGNFKKIVGVRQVNHMKEEDEIQEQELKKATRWNVNLVPDIPREEVIAKIEHEENMLKIAKDYRSKPISDLVTLKQQAAIERDHWKLAYKGELSSLHPEIINFKVVNHRLYFGCPRCGCWVYKNLKNPHNCKPFALNQSLLTVKPRRATEPFMIEIWREKNKHGSAMCVLCGEIFTTGRTNQVHKCQRKTEIYSRNPYVEAPKSSLEKTSYSVSINPHKLFFHKQWKYVLGFTMLHEQPLRQNMIYSQDISANQCKPIIQVTEMEVSDKRIICFVQTGPGNRGVIAAELIPAGICVGFVGGDIVKYEFARFLQFSSSFEPTIGHNSQNFCFAPVQHFTGLSWCKRTDQDPNCEIRFGIFNGKVRAYLFFLKDVHKGDEIEIQQTMSYEISQNLMEVSSRGKVLKEGQKESVPIEPVMVECSASESESEGEQSPVSIDIEALKRFRADK